MLDSLSQFLEYVAPYVVATHLLFLLVVTIIGIVAIVFLSPYLGRFAIFAISSSGRFVISVISSSVRLVGFVFSWQPKELVGASRDHRLSDSDPERHS